MNIEKEVICKGLTPKEDDKEKFAQKRAKKLSKYFYRFSALFAIIGMILSSIGVNTYSPIILFIAIGCGVLSFVSFTIAYLLNSEVFDRSWWPSWYWFC